METNKSVFSTLNAVNCNEHTEKKNNLTYLSWAWAWAEVKKLYPNASYTIYENAQQWNYFTDGKTCWVKTGVTIEGLEHIDDGGNGQEENGGAQLGNGDMEEPVHRSGTV